MSQDKQLTDLTELTTPADGDYVYVVDVSDTTDDAAGSSRKVQLANARGWPQTSAESAAGVTPTNLEFSPGDIRRYGDNTTPGTTDMSTALQAAIDQNEQGGPPVVLQPDTYAFGTTLDFADDVTIRGAGLQATLLKYTGAAQGFVNKTPTSRVYNLNIRDLSLTDAGTGTVGFDCQNLSLGFFENVRVNSFDTGWEFSSPANSTVYNRFVNCTANLCGIGWDMQALSSNSNSWWGCRFNGCTTGLKITDSNQNQAVFCQFETCTTGIDLDATGAAKNVRTMILGCRFEGNTEDWNVGTDVGDAVFIMNHYVTLDLGYTDNGTRTQIMETQGDASLWKQVSALPDVDGTPWYFERVTSATNNPMWILKDSNTGSGTPTTLEIDTGRGVGKALRIKQNGTDTFNVLANGRIQTNQDSANTNTPSGATAHQIPIYNESGTLLGYIPVYGSAW